MLTDETKELILPQLRMHISEEDYSKIDLYFSEVYEYNQDGIKLIALFPGMNDDISMLFDAMTGSYYDIQSWDYVKKYGERL